MGMEYVRNDREPVFPNVTSLIQSNATMREIYPNA